MTSELRIKYAKNADLSLPLPTYATPGAAGLDLRACLGQEERDSGKIIMPRCTMLVETGFSFEIPQGYEGQIRARSGLALKNGISLANGVGTIDSDYRGNLSVILENRGNDPYCVKHGQRIAQLVISPILKVKCRLVESIENTARGALGFGSTGKM